MLWGLTPALDLIDEYKSIQGNLPPEINIMIVGGADCRHVLKTLARKYKHENIKINFYLVEPCIENIGRQLLLLNIALQPQEVMGLDQKTKTFMELYGNTLVRPSVAKFLTSLSSNLVKMITNYDHLKEMMNFVNLDIKYKERDYLENLLKFWMGRDEFNICDCWDRRLRKILGVRFDSKAGAFDWDLHMRLHNIGGRQVCNQEYRNFRMNGIAFSWLESEVSKPNRTFVCAIMPNGEKLTHYGYLGDMQTGPFVAYGLDCDDKKFLESTNGQNSYRATDVTERNLKQIFHEIQNGKEFVHKPTTDVKLGPIMMKQEKLIVDIKAIDIIPKPVKKCICLEDKINFLSISVLKEMKYKDAYNELFDIVYFGSTYLKYFDKETIERTTKNNAMIFIEHQLFVLSNRKKELVEFEKMIEEKIDSSFVKLEFDVEKDSYAKFVVNKNVE